jgi:hypothetical protein
MIIMMIFNISTSHFSQKSTSLFLVLFNDETDIRVRVILNLGQGAFLQFF